MIFKGSFGGYSKEQVREKVNENIERMKILEEDGAYRMGLGRAEGEFLLGLLHFLRAEYEEDKLRVELNRRMSSLYDGLIQYASMEAMEKIEQIRRETEDYEREAMERMAAFEEEKKKTISTLDLFLQDMEEIFKSLSLAKKQKESKEVEWKNRNTQPAIKEKEQKKILNIEPEKEEKEKEIGDKVENKRVLVIEHGEETRKLMIHVLKREGMHTVLARDGKEGLEKIEKMKPPAVVVMNSSLPYVDGVEIIRIIREKEEWNKIPIFLLTNNHGDQDIVKILEAGATDCITIPFDPKALVTKIKKWIV